MQHLAFISSRTLFAFNHRGDPLTFVSNERSLVKYYTIIPLKQFSKGIQCDKIARSGTMRTILSEDHSEKKNEWMSGQGTMVTTAVHNIKEVQKTLWDAYTYNTIVHWICASMPKTTENSILVNVAVKVAQPKEGYSTESNEAKASPTFFPKEDRLRSYIFHNCRWQVAPVANGFCYRHIQLATSKLSATILLYVIRIWEKESSLQGWLRSDSRR